MLKELNFRALINRKWFHDENMCHFGNGKNSDNEIRVNKYGSGFNHIEGTFLINFFPRD